MGPRFQNVDRNTPMLLPPDPRDWVGEDDLVHFVIQAVERLPMGQRVSQSASDGGELEADLKSIPESMGNPGQVLADCGYLDGAMFERLVAQGIEPMVSVHREDAHSERRYEFRPSKNRKPPKNITDPRLIAMREKLQSEEGKKTYKLRAQTVEPVFGIIKHVLGFRQFLLRGVEKVSGEWSLVCLAYNLKRLHVLRAQG